MTRPDAASLRGLCSGGVFLPGDEGYDRARTTWALATDLQPAAVVFPTDADEVASVVGAAPSSGLRIAPLGTGHNAQALGDLSGSVLVRTNELAGVAIDPQARRARVLAGTVWRDVVAAAAPYGLAAPHGSSPDTGVVGYLLGGGLSWYGREIGLAANSVTAVELVTADGSLVRVTAQSDPELFWALRGGGGGNFGVVTAVEFDLYPVETVYAGMLVWDLRQAHQVLSRWVDWTADAPETVTTSYRHLHYPPLPMVPAAVRGRDVVIIDGVVLADDAEAERILAPLRELPPQTDTFARVPADSLVRLHLDPEEPTPALGRGALLGLLPPAAVDRLVEVAGPDAGTSLLAPLELRQLGGALGRAPEHGGVLSTLDGQYQLLTGGLSSSPQQGERTIADCERIVEAMLPYATGRQYLNFTEDQVDPATGFDPALWHTLRLVRTEVDAGNLFQANHEIPALP